ncbi:MAG: hypothetical protein OHK0013_18530 [Sandaracinaceae bacterium]
MPRASSRRASFLVAAATLALGVLSASSRASAQFIPTACDMSERGVTYGSLGVGSLVQLNVHSPWRGDANWTPEMNRYVGMTASITSLEGVDGVGCPVVRVNVDGGQFYWRIRDMRWVGGSVPMGDPIPRYCGMTASAAQFGAVAPGVAVVLGAHTFAGAGDDLNWADEMRRWVGMRTVVTSLERVDNYGCPVVRVAADGGQFYWRIRDMQFVAAVAPPPPPPQVVTVPTWCGMPAGAEQYGPIRPGSWVMLGAHTADVGDPNWAAEMARWVGQQTTVTGLAGADAQGCPTVRVAADGGQYAWRIRNMTFLR